MKTKVILIGLFACCATMAWGQLKVAGNGNVAIGYGALMYTPQSALTVGGTGSTATEVHITAVGGYKLHGLEITNGGFGSKYGIHATAGGYGSNNVRSIAIQGYVGTYTPNYAFLGFVYGVRGITSGSPNLTSAYSVSGLMLGNNGAGVYGGVTDTEATITGAYAGYFNGNTAVVNGLLSARVISLGPAVKIDSFIPIRKEQVIADLSQLQPVAYYRRQVEVPMDSTNTEGEVVHYSIPRYDESSPAFRHKQYGLIAEDVQKVYPDMVYETPDGLAIDYVGLVPVLLQAVRSQQAAINAIQQQLDAV